ncbi:MAG: hypothetical protein ABI175_21605 [Polyangiales bacterium]
MVSPPSLRRRLVSAAVRLALLVGLVLGALLVNACIAPTLPVPPPLQPDVSESDTAGLVTISGAKGSVASYAEVSVFNLSYAESSECKTAPDCTPGAFRNANADGSYLMRVKARSKDVLYLWQTTDNGQSASIEIHVR